MTVSMVQALNRALRDAMLDSERVILMGEDIGLLGGVFRVTDGLIAEFGGDRVIDTPLSESTIVGAAIGLAMRGYHPVVEMQFDGFTYPAFDQIVAHLARLRYRSRGQVQVPVVVRIPYGGGIGAAEHHSESPEAYFTHTSGLKVYAPSLPADAYSLLRAAISGSDPVIFLEPKHDYWLKQDVTLPIETEAEGVARVVRAGTHVVLVSYGPAVKLCLAAADYFANEGVMVEVIDLRTLNPLDEATVVAAVKRIGRVVVVHEAPLFGGFGGELLARISNKCFFDLLAPPERVGALSTPYPPSAYESNYLPDVDKVVDAIDRCLTVSDHD